MALYAAMVGDGGLLEASTFERLSRRFLQPGLRSREGHGEELWDGREWRSGIGVIILSG